MLALRMLWHPFFRFLCCW